LRAAEINNSGDTIKAKFTPNNQRKILKKEYFSIEKTAMICRYKN